MPTSSILDSTRRNAFSTKSKEKDMDKILAGIVKVAVFLAWIWVSRCCVAT